MKKLLSWLLLASGILSGCTLQRPDQDNFLVDASAIGGAELARDLSSSMNTRLDSTQLTLPDWNGAEEYDLRGRGFMLILVPLPDERCNPNAVRPYRFSKQLFRIDLVYTNSSQEARQAAKQNLLSRLNKLRVPVEKFRECE